MATQANKTVDFNEQMAAEREFYLGKTDKVPNSTMTVKEAREAQMKVNAEYEKERIERAQRVRNEVLENDAAFQAGRGAENSYTTVVVPGVNAQINNPVAVPLEVVLAQNTQEDLYPLPTDAELAHLDVAELITLAGNRGVEVKANVDTKAALIARLKSEYTDARFESLHGKTRDQLDALAIELGLGADADAVKAGFANVDLLTAAIEKARK